MTGRVQTLLALLDREGLGLSLSADGDVGTAWNDQEAEVYNEAFRLLEELTRPERLELATEMTRRWAAFAARVAPR